MLYTKPVSKPDFKVKSAAFSLIEILVTLFIVVIILAILAPTISKKIGSRQTEGIVYTYTGSNETEDDKCFITNTTKYDDTFSLSNIEYLTTRNCTKYEFTVPDGVTSVNLTLVAGGGGGGGAAGGTLFTTNVSVENRSNRKIDFPFRREDLKSVDIDYMVGMGGNGEASRYVDSSDENKPYPNLIYSLQDEDFYNNVSKYSSSLHYFRDVAIYPGKGGNSSAAIYNYKIPSELFRQKHEDVFSIGNKLSLHMIASNGAALSPAQFRLLDAEKRLFDYQVTGAPAASDKSGISCKYDAADNTVKDCPYLIPNQNIFTSREGRDVKNSVRIVGYGYSGKIRDALLDTTYNYGMHKGGEGGYLPMYPSYGKGGAGRGIMAQFLSCTPLTNFDDVKLYLEGRCIKYNTAPKYSTETNTEGKSIYYFECRTGGLSSTKKGICDEVAKGECLSHHPEDGDTYCSNPSNLSAYGSATVLNNCQTYVDNSNNYNERVYAFHCPTEGDSWVKTGGPSYIKGKYTAEYPGGVGGGGSGGAYVQIKNMQVTPGTRYIIRVGQGGKGGASGKYGYNDGANPSAGQNGAGGATTSIWRVDGDNEILEYMVTGGAGGEGGQIYSGDDSDTYTEQSKYEEDKGHPGRSVAIVMSDNQNNMERTNQFVTNKVNIYDDSKLCPERVELRTSLRNTMTTIDYESNQRRCLRYTNFENATPYTFFSYLNGNLSPNNNTSRVMAGFSEYTMDDDVLYRVDGVDYYSSYYYRNLVGSNIGYLGGLGGFSGLGGKAGCGGLFLGNAKGQVKANTLTFNSKGAKKIFLNNGNATNQYSMADVSDYYDNCTTDTPNGQTATYIAPSPQGRTLGQAGAGGGGGGYTLFEGPGIGGNGQNGYLMIDWRK